MYSVSNILTGKVHVLGHALEWQQDFVEMAAKRLDRLRNIVRSKRRAPHLRGMDHRWHEGELHHLRHIVKSWADGMHSFYRRWDLAVLGSR
jgi:hypothetical protein